MAKKPNPADLSTRVLMVTLGSERRWKRVALLAGGGAIVLGAGAYVVVSALDTKAKAEREVAWSSLSACLIGTEPLKDKETAATRARAIQLQVLGVPKQTRAAGGGVPWPAACATFAHQLAESTRGSGDAKTGLAPSADALAKVLAENASGLLELRAEVDKVWKEAEKLGLKAGPPPAGVKVPAKIERATWTSEQFKDLPRTLSGAFAMTNVRPDPVVSTRAGFVVDQKDVPEGPVHCSAGPTETGLKCTRLPPAALPLSPGLRPLGTFEDGKRPLFVAGDRGSTGVFTPDGEKLATVSLMGAWLRDDGGAWLVARKDAKTPALMFAAPKGQAAERPLFGPGELESPLHATVAWDWLIARTKAGKLVARKLPAGAGEAGPAIEIGELGEPAPVEVAPGEDDVVTACRASDNATVFVRVRGGKSDSFAVFSGSKWSGPWKTGAKGGTLSCSPASLTITKTTHAVTGDKNLATVAQTVCSRAGECTQGSTGIVEMTGGQTELAPADAQGFSAASIADKVAVVYHAGLIGGVRLRVAPIAKLRDAEDHAIFDPREEGGTLKLGTFLDVKVIPASTFAVVLVGTTHGVRALRLDATGALTPLGASL